MGQPDDDTPNSRRNRRAHRSRRRLRSAALVVGGVVLAALLTGSALAVTGVVDLSDESGGEPRSETADPGPTSTSAPRTGTSQPESAERECREPLTADDPLRLWIGGDSLAGSLGPSLGAMTGGTGVIQPVFLSKVSSGLASPEFFDWPERAAEQMLEVDPEVAVFIIGANDTSVAQGDAAAWRPEYQRTVDEMMMTLIGEGRRVYWVGAPVLGDDRTDEVEELNTVFRDIAKFHPEVAYVDAYALFSDPEGKYARSLPGPDGESVLVRADDGVHFTPEGGDRLAFEVFAQLDPRCAISTQAIEGEDKVVIEAEGSTRVPGTSRETGTTATTVGSGSAGSSPSGGTGSGSSTGTGSGSSTPTPTSPPATSPPPTSPPPTSPPPTSPPPTTPVPTTIIPAE